MYAETISNKSTEGEYEGDLLGYFTITHYCICSKCCGKTPDNPAYGITASGTEATPGRTIATDTSVVPLNTKVKINGHIYTAEDTGSAIVGNKIDICVASHEEGIQLGVLYDVPVYIVED